MSINMKMSSQAIVCFQAASSHTLGCFQAASKLTHEYGYSMGRAKEERS